MTLSINQAADSLREIEKTGYRSASAYGYAKSSGRIGTFTVRRPTLSSISPGWMSNCPGIMFVLQFIIRFKERRVRPQTVTCPETPMLTVDSEQRSRQMKTEP